jgi:hypothetical protein
VHFIDYSCCFGDKLCFSEVVCSDLSMVMQVLTAIELARNARIAANKAFFATLASSTKTTSHEQGDIRLQQSALPVDHPLVLAAARQLAQAAALEDARQQVPMFNARALKCCHVTWGGE